MFKDEQRYEVWERIRQQDLRAFSRLLPHSLLTEVAKRSGVPIVRSALAIPNLIWLGLLSAAFSTKSFAEVLSSTVRLLDFSANGLPEPVARASRNAKRRSSKRSKHDPRGHDPLVVSEEAFAQARKRMPLWLWTVLIEMLTERFEADYERLVRWKQFRLLTLDGTCLQLPKWKKLSDHFGVAKNGRSKGRAQARMVMLQLPLVRLPWRYELSGIDDGERTIAERLLRGVRADDLILMDQGFWSYGLFHQIQAAGGYFAIRRYPGVKFETLQRLGPKERLVRWKTPTGPRWRGKGLPDSIDLRVIDYEVKGFRPTAVVTNVLDPQDISRDEWIHMASEAEAGRPLDRRVRLRVGLYHRRWEIETTFHELKVVQGMERVLRSRTPESIQYEVAGHILLYLLVRWLMVEAAQRTAPDGDPLGASFKHAFEELLTAWPLLVTSNPSVVSRRILPRLLVAIASHEVCWRPGRSFPRKKDNSRLRSRVKSKPKKNAVMKT